jgi:ribosomal small subunit protein bTHX
MGKGDKRSKRGKYRLGTFGVRRPRKSKNRLTLHSKLVPVTAETAAAGGDEEKPKASKGKAAKGKTTRKKTTTAKKPPKKEEEK